MAISTPSKKNDFKHYMSRFQSRDIALSTFGVDQQISIKFTRKIGEGRFFLFIDSKRKNKFPNRSKSYGFMREHRLHALNV